MKHFALHFRPAEWVKTPAFARLATGLAWGLAASWLMDLDGGAWAKGHAAAFLALLAIVGGLPFVLLAGIGRLRPISLAGWAAAVAILAALYGAYDQWREPFESYGPGNLLRSSLSASFTLIGWAWLFIAHHQVEPADLERTWRPTYRSRFESASRNLFQLVFAAAFAAFVFGVVKLGGVLFKIIGMPWLDEASGNDWVYPSVLAISFATAVHLTDVRPVVIRSVRTLALNLLSWILPLLTALVLAFLCAAPFSRVKGLWQGWLPSGAVLWTVVVLIVLINAAYQDGQRDVPPPRVLRWSSRLAGLALVPLTGLAGYGLAVRVGHYGLSPQRVWALAVLAICSLYALGYAWAAADRRTWMTRLEPVNVAAAGFVLVVALLLCSPLLDPARLAVADQMHRLQIGRTPTEKLDILALRFRDGRFGREALQTLARSSDPKLATRARLGLASRNRYAETDQMQLQPAFSGVTVYPSGAKLPDSLRRQTWPIDSSPDCFTSGMKCGLLLADVNGDGVLEAVVQERLELPTVLSETAKGWVVVGRYGVPDCPPLLADLASSQAQPGPPLAQDLLVKGVRVPFVPQVQCSGRADASPPNLAAQSHLVEIH